MSVLTIDSSAINAKKTQFKNEGTKFNSNAYNTFKTGYISTCSDSTVQRMKSNLNTLYKAIENGYKEINNYWDNYLKDFDSLENSLKSFSASCSNATVNSYLSGMSDLLPQVPKKATSFVKIKNVNYKADEGNSTKSKTKSGLSSILEGIGIGANTVISGAKSGLTKVKNGIADAYSKVSNKANVVINKAKSGLTILKSGAKMAGNFVKNAVKAQIETDKIIISTTGSVLKHVGQGMINWGENLWCFLLKGGGGNPISAGLIRSYNNNMLQLGDIIISDSKTLKDFDFYIDLPFYSTANENNDYVNDMIKDIKGGDDLVDSFDTTKIAKKMEKTSLVKNDSVVASVGEGVGEAIPTIALAYLTGGGSLAMGAVGYATGSGEGYANALLDGATTNEAEISSNIKGALSGISWYIGGELNQTGVAKSIATKLGISATVAEKPITSSAIRVIGDALDGASTPFTDSISKLVYAKGYTDKDGNYKEFTKDDNVFDRYKKIFEENGGWKSVGVGAIIGGGLSGVNEAVDFSFKRGDYGVDFDTNKTKTNGNEGFDNTGKNTDGNYKNKTDGDTGKTNNKTNTDNNTKTDEKFKETKKVKSEGEIMAELREKLDRGEITKKEYHQRIKEIHPDEKIYAEEAAKKAKNVDNNVKNTDTTNAKQTNTKDVKTKYTDDSWDVSKKIVASDEKAVTKYKEVGDMTTKNDINTKVTKNINTTNDSKWTINNRQISPDQDIKIKDVEMNTDASVKEIDGGTTKTDYSNMSESELRQRIKDLEAERTKIDESIEKISNDTSTWHKDYEKMGKYIDLTDELNEAKAALAMKNSANNTPKLGTDKPNVFLEKKPDPTPLLDGGGALSTGATAAKIIGDNIDDVNVNVDKSFNKPIKMKELEEFYNQFPAQRRGVNQDIIGLTMEKNPSRTIDYINQVKKTFPDLSDADALKLLENMNRNKSGLCSYAASLNTTLVTIGESIPDFKKKFGYDFSRTTAGGYKVLNDDLMLIDLYCYLNENLVKDGKYVGGSEKNFNYLMESKYTVNESDIADWLKTKGIDAKIDVKTIKNNFMDLPEDFSLSTEVKKELSDGNQVLIMVNTSDANKLVLHMDEVGINGEKINIDQSLFGGGHFLTVIGMKDSDTFIVQTWGKKYDVKVSDLEKVMTGAFSVDTNISNPLKTQPNNEIFGFFKKKKTDVDIFAKRPPTHTEVYRDLKIMSDSADGLQRLKNYVDQLDRKGSQTFRSAYFLSKIRESGAIITNICDPNEAFFNTSTRVVHLGDNVINNNQIETIFHELGHKVDNMNYYYEQGKTIVNYSLRDISKDTINNGFEKFRKDYNTYYNKLWSDIYVNDSFKNRITKETNERYYSLYDKYDKKVYNEIEKNVKFELLDTILRESGYSTISDIFDALKQGEVHDKYKMPGHGKKYYDPNKGGYSFSTEIIANFSSLYNSNKTDMLDNYLPSSFREKITNGYEDLIDISHTKVTLDSYKFYNSNLPKQILAYLSDGNINHIESGSSAKAAIQSMSKTELMKYITSQESYASILDYAKEITDKKYGNGNFVKNLTSYLSTKNSNLLTRDNNIRDYISYLSPDQIRIWLKRDRANSTKFYKPGDLD